MVSKMLRELNEKQRFGGFNHNKIRELLRFLNKR